MPGHLAIVPAYNESAVDRRASSRSCGEHAPGLRRRRRRRRLHRRHRPTAPARPAPRSCATRSTSASAAPCSRATMYALERGYDVAVQVDGDGQHDPRHLADLLEHLSAHPELDMVTGSRFLADDGEGYRSSAPRRVGHPHLRAACCRASSAAGDRPDVGLPHGRPPRHRAVRPRLPARLPRGRGGAADARHQLASVELPVRMRERTGGVSSINSTRSVYYMIKVLLAVFVGLLRARPTVRGRRPRAGRRRSRRSAWTSPDPDRRDRRHRRAVHPRLRARAPAPADGALRAAVAVRLRRPARRWRSGAARSRSSPRRSGSPTRRRRCSRSRSASCSCCCCTSRS